MTVNQNIHNVSAEIKEHFVEELLVINKFDYLINKLDIYEMAHRICTAPAVRNINVSSIRKGAERITGTV